jgi:hypothetical protein
MTTPNIYILQNSTRGGHVVYSTAAGGSIAGLQYSDPLKTHEFRAADLRIIDSEIGKLVTGTTRKTIDTGSTTFTLVVPVINLGPSRTSPIMTFGITTLHRFSPVPALNQGQVEIYSVVELQGTAEFVTF